MENYELENEIELRMNPDDFSLSPGDLNDIMNQFDLSEEDAVLAYNKVISEKIKELEDETKDIVNYFREKGNYYPSFNEFKKEFNQNDLMFFNDEILRDMYNKEINDENQLSLFEIKQMIKEAFKTISEEDEFEKDAAEITKNWGGEIKKSPNAMLGPEDIFDIADAGAEAKKDIEDEFGEDEFSPMSNDEYKAIMNNLNEDEEEITIGPEGLFRAKDSQGNEIKKMTLVKPVNSEVDKKGRVMGFGDDGKGNQIVIVDYQWPLDLKYMAPKEMGEIKEYPQDLIVQGINENLEEDKNNLKGVEVTYEDGTVIPTSIAANLSDEDIHNYFKVGRMFNIGNVEDNMQAVKSVNIIRETMNEELNEEEIVDDIDTPKEDEIDEARGLSHTAKNTGDRNAKKDNKNHSHAPVTTLPEGRTLDEKIKTLSEGKLKKKDLLNFIGEQARKFADDINNK